ncbi:MAG: hypothetical protein M1833_005348 [Piccolia ochrophora]|nr:MAG: hypothetical protein M1833_005348 [Piccolia ochrophora]
MKRSSDHAQPIENPFIKRQNWEWELSPPSSLAAPISPPRSNVEAEQKVARTNRGTTLQRKENDENKPSLAAIEAGEADIQDHLTHFCDHLSAFTARNSATPRLSVENFADLYKRNQHPHGRHFVVHQHDHPVAGVHYDLRLQFSESSSISFAIMYGLPGNANSKRLNRNATETRVHTLWNHLVEAASPSTGSLLIWDTGEYEILPFRTPQTETDSSSPSSSSSISYSTHRPKKDTHASLPENEKLIDAFHHHRIRLRLHGTHLPPNYTISLRLPTSNNTHAQPRKPAYKRRRTTAPAPARDRSSSSPSPPPSSPIQTPSSQPTTPRPAITDETIRLTNAYPGANNTIGSIHQRRWYLSLDRTNSGFVRTRTANGGVEWVKRSEEEGFPPFFVRGRDVERSVVTGRGADEVMRDEGVEGFVGRKGWRAVME